MAFLSFILDIVLLLATIVFYFLKKFRPNIKSSNQITAPEPPGAWPVIGHLHLLGGQMPVARTLGALADKYGPVFSLRFGSQKALVVSNHKAIKDCFTTNDRIFASRPYLAVGKYIGYNYAVFALAPYGPFWREIRKLITLELLTANRLQKLSHVRASEADHFVRDLYSRSAKHPDKALAINHCLEYFAFNITLRMLVGKRFSIGSGDEHDKDYLFKEAVKRALYFGGVFVWSDAIPSLEWLDIGGYIRGMKEVSKELDEVLEGWVKERIGMRKESGYEAGDQSDFMDVMLSAIQENKTMSGYSRETVIKATILILIMTGSESTGETLIWGLSLLLNNPRVIKIAQDEIKAKVGPHKWVQESDIKNLSYLQAIVKETLRLYPPGPLSGPREALEDCYVSNYFVPKGTRLVVNLWKLQRDPNVWEEPDEFRPERFLNENVDVNFKGQCFEYIPFSSGRRMCPGMTFGMQVVHLGLARLLQGFDMSTPMGMPVDMGEGLGIALPKLKPLEVVLSPRLSPELYQNL